MTYKSLPYLEVEKPHSLASTRKTCYNKVLKHLEFWLTFFDLGSWRLLVTFNDHELGDGNCRPAWHYKSGKLNFSLNALHTEKDEWIKEVVIHECLHLLLDPLSDDNEEKLEFVTSTIARQLLQIGY